MLKKIRTTELHISRCDAVQKGKTYEAPRARTPYALGTLVLASKSRRTGYLLSCLSAWCLATVDGERETYLRVELVDLTRDELVGLLGVGVVDKVVFDLLGLGCHLVVSSILGASPGGET